MSASTSTGFTYWVSDEQIAAYASLPIGRRLLWLEEAARLTYSLATPEVRARWARLRAGASIDAPDDPAAIVDASAGEGSDLASDGRPVP